MGGDTAQNDATTRVARNGNRAPMDDEAPSSDSPPGSGHTDTAPTVTGSKSRQRTPAKRSSYGLAFCHVDMDSPDLWKFDPSVGMLYFNITHPVWVECDTNDSNIMRLQEVIAVHALTAELMPEAERAHLQPFLQGICAPLVSLLVHSPSFVPALRARRIAPAK